MSHNRLYDYIITEFICVLKRAPRLIFSFDLIKSGNDCFSNIQLLVTSLMNAHIEDINVTECLSCV